MPVFCLLRLIFLKIQPKLFREGSWRKTCCFQYQNISPSLSTKSPGTSLLQSRDLKFGKGASFAHVLLFFDLPVEISLAFLNLQAFFFKQNPTHLGEMSPHLTAEAFKRRCGVSVVLLWLCVPCCGSLLSTATWATGMLLTVVSALCSLRIWELASPGVLKQRHPVRWGGTGWLARRQKWKKSNFKGRKKGASWDQERGTRVLMGLEIA